MVPPIAAKVQPKEDEKERPFTDDKMVKLFSGQPNQSYLKDVMLIGALTGARIDAIIGLKRKDITEDGNIRFKPQKREKASRMVPIHSALKSTMERLVDGKQPDDDPFPECPPVAADAGMCGGGEAAGRLEEAGPEPATGNGNRLSFTLPLTPS